MISGSAFADNDNRCYLAVMNNNKDLERHNAWYIGNILLQDYYVVFDATSRDVNSTNQNLRIGFSQMARIDWAKGKFKE